MTFLLLREILAQTRAFLNTASSTAQDSNLGSFLGLILGSILGSIHVGTGDLDDFSPFDDFGLDEGLGAGG